MANKMQRRAKLERFSGECTRVLPYLYVAGKAVALDKEALLNSGVREGCFFLIKR